MYLLAKQPAVTEVFLRVNYAERLLIHHDSRCIYVTADQEESSELFM
jgi:hypothetical protein